MPRILMRTALLLGLCSAAAGQPESAASLRVGVDLRAELFAIIWRLAGSHVYNMGTLEPYVSEIDDHFGSYEDHPAVELARGLLEMGVDFSAVMTVAIHTTGVDELREKVPLDAPGGVLAQRGLPPPRRTEFAAAVRRFLDAAREFVAEEREEGHVYMHELFELLDEYEANRSRYPTFDAFMPRIAEYYASLAGRIDELKR